MSIFEKNHRGNTEDTENFQKKNHYLSYAANSIPVFFISLTNGFPELKSSLEIGSILESIFAANNIN